MHAPRRKAFNSVNAASLARWIAITASLAITGLIYVYLSLQLHDLGTRKKGLETELTNLRAENEVASAQIAALTSRSAMQRRLKEGYLRMIPISEQSIVRLNATAHLPAEDGIQPIANLGARK